MGLSTTTILIIAIPVLILLALLLRSALQKPARGKVSPSARQPKPAQSKPAPRNPYRATSISIGRNACAAAQAIAEKRFLVEEDDIPKLPLEGCDVADCTCTYAHHADRRDNEEVRRAPAGLRTDLHSHLHQTERRVKRGRRSTDWE